MRGVFVQNGFMDSPKFREPGIMLRRAADSMGVQLDILPNKGVCPPIGDRKSLNALLNDPDFVIFWDKDVRCASNMELCGLRLYNSSECIRICDDKSLTHIELARRGIPSPRTVMSPLTFLQDYDDLSFLDSVPFGFPMVVKDCFGSFGQQVHLARDADELRELFSQGYRPRIIQEYVECGASDLRIEVVGGVVADCVRRTGAPGDFRSNCTNGGVMSNHEPSDEESELAIRACEAVGADFAGVDILTGPDGPMVCEVNSNAHLRNLENCTGRDVASVILGYITGDVRS